MRKTLPAILAVLLLAAIVHAEATTPAAVEGMLTRLNVTFHKGPAGDFEFKLGFPDAKPETLMVRALPAQKILYLAITDVAKIPPTGPGAEARFRNLASLNYQLTVGKLEWDRQSHEVRLSYTFAADQVVEYGSFVAIVQTLLAEIDAVRKQLNAPVAP